MKSHSEEEDKFYLSEKLLYRVSNGELLAYDKHFKCWFSMSEGLSVEDMTTFTSYFKPITPEEAALKLLIS